MLYKVVLINFVCFILCLANLSNHGFKLKHGFEHFVKRASGVERTPKIDMTT